MAKQLLREYFELCPNGICRIDYLNEAEQRSLTQGSKYLTGVCQRAGVKNGNGRIYPRQILEREVEKYQAAIKNRTASAMGECDHPDTAIVAIKESSHICTGLWWEGNDLMGKFEILPTPNGQILRSLIESRVKFGISSRALGSLRETREGSMVEDDLQLICFDVVSEPSTAGAYILPDNSGLAEALKKQPPLTNSTHLNNLIESILRS